MFSSIKVPIPTIIGDTMEVANDTLVPGADEDAFIFIVGLCVCIVFLLIIHTASNIIIYRQYNYDNFIAEQRLSLRARRGGQREAGESLPRYTAEDPTTWGLLDSVLGAQIPPPTYQTIVTAAPPYDEDEEQARERDGTSNGAVVALPQYVNQEDISESHSSDDPV
ncbi:uncharacterized protein ColSpa_11680 [Colletotrichum spaethianum]|uniref:Uncharacterized protein n=1 Tax=Colletotrichum spaethianum TaxID=700344 RepID=A0AA37PFY5_9PEZI|nr:uncharacterized protein ColSpa_11680 [Colletotrichum spaethianum]GKT51499.1 hypothetical protein ColSpa_11680 [Colletotrichum spaethianum]